MQGRPLIEVLDTTSAGELTMATENTTPETKPARIRDKDKFRLWAWVIGMEGRINAEKLGPSDLTRMAKTELGLDLNKDHLRHALHTAGIPIHRSKQETRSNQYLKAQAVILARIDALEVRADQAEARSVKLEADLAALGKLMEETAANLDRRMRVVNGPPAPLPNILKR
jgi:hypothetical protein